MPVMIVSQSWNDSNIDGGTLDADFVGAPQDPEVPILAPGGAPGVLHDPILLAGALLYSVAHHQHRVVHNLHHDRRCFIF